MATGKFDRPERPPMSERRMAALVGKEQHAAVVDTDTDHEKAESYKTEEPELGSQPEEPAAKASTVVKKYSGSEPGTDEVGVPMAGVGADIPDRGWVKAADLRAGSEPGAPEHVAAVQAEVQAAQPTEGMGPDQVAALEEVEAHKRAVSEKAIADIQSTDFQVGGPELTYLAGGVPVEHAEALSKHQEHKQRKAAAKATKKLLGKK